MISGYNTSMVSKALFKTAKGKEPNTVNEAGGKAYTMEAKHALAQLAVTGCLGNTFYASAETQLNTVLDLLNSLEPTRDNMTFVAKLAAYSRHKGFMKDMPALIVAWMTKVKTPDGKFLTGTCGWARNILSFTFDDVIDDGKMLRNYYQIIRSGKLGSKSLGNASLIKTWFETRTDEQLFDSNIGNPSLKDIIRTAHPKHRPFFKYLMGYELSAAEVESLPTRVREFEAFKKDPTLGLPDVNFMLLTSLPLTEAHWVDIASNMSWQQLRINLNNLEKHGVLKDRVLVDSIASKLRDEEAIVKAKAMPYQLYQAYKNFTSDNAYANEIIGTALQDAFEISLKNAPKLTGLSYVFVDVSGSMGYSVTSGYNSKTRFVDIAAMFASAIKKSNPEAVIVPFNDFVIDYKINSRDSSMTITSQLAALCTGGTRTSSCLEYLKKNKIKPDNIIFISDNMSWEDKIPANTIYQDVKTATSKLICIDIAPYTSTQFDYGKNVLHIGGFNDSVFAAIEAFLNGTTNFVEVIMDLDVHARSRECCGSEEVESND